MYKKLTVIFISVCSIFIYLFFFHNKSIETIIYFPPDQAATFTNYKTNLSLSDDENIIWEIESNSDEPVYLRQDVSVIYANGQFKGVINLWKQHVSHLNKQQRISHDGNTVYDTMTFHHGEIHRQEDDITSIQQMSTNELYVYMHHDNHYSSFYISENKLETNIEHQLNELKQRSLNNYWKKLIDHFNIDEHQYVSIPLIDLVKFQEESLPTLSMEQTHRVIGQLWEGLYKNYIIPVASKKNNQIPHYMPLILVDKKGKHLYVLFELNGEKKILKQKI